MSRIAGNLSKFTPQEIKQLYQDAYALTRTIYFVLLVAPATKDYGRMLLVAPKRIGSAPERNKLKRQFRSIFYEEKLYERGYDCVVIFKNRASEAPFETLKSILLEAFKKLD